ncbi:MAG: paraquat-inducible protein A [Janthinobacterium lividum]
MQTTELIACRYCDALHRKVAIQGREAARCTRCDAVLYRMADDRVERVLALAIAALIVFVIANAFPIVQLESQGITINTTLFGAIVQLWEQQRYIIALIVLCSTILFPLTELLALIYLLGGICRGEAPRFFNQVLRAVLTVRPWGMLEVFMLGVLVTLVKLSGYAQLMLEPGLFAFGGLTLLITAVLAFDPRTLWDFAEQRLGVPGAHIIPAPTVALQALTPRTREPQ